eukprot:TRINITY_DN13955_c0_g2_i1.p1 TRINITY_DN13955_c0_g2~~TRINITY_DN13955_c0_g2_i1.p1  ORF type:complete len:951 (+),score=309.30 TRINITY_DN13955_c0_g2_i1:303-2855(+)
MQTECEAYMRSLCKLTNAGQRKPVRERQLSAFRAVLRVARSEADGLGVSWRPLLDCVLEMERLLVIGQELSAAPQREPSRLPRRQRPRHPPEEAASAREVAAALDLDAFSRLYRHTTSMTPEGLRDCVAALADCVGAEGPLPPARRVALTRLTQVAVLNAGGRLLGFWREVATRLVQVVTQGNAEWAAQGVDALRRAVDAAVSSAELMGGEAQPQLLRPYLSVMESGEPGQHVRDLVLRCLTQLTLARPHAIGPGWPVVMRCLVCTLRHSDPPSVGIAAGLLAHVAGSPDVLAHAAPYAADLVHCATFLAANELHSKVACEAAELLRDLPGRVAAAPPCPTPPDISPRSKACLSPLPGSDAVERRLQLVWELCFQALCFMVTHPADAARLRAVEALHEMAMRWGGSWTAELWGAFSGRLLPACAALPCAHPELLRRREAWAHFRHWGLQGALQRCGAEEWAQTTLPHIATQLAAEPAVHFCELPAARSIAVPGACAALCAVALHGGESAVILAAEQLTRLLHRAGGGMTPPQWRAACMSCCRLIRHSALPPGLLDRALAAGRQSPSPSSPLSPDAVAERRAAAAGEQGRAEGACEWVRPGGGEALQRLLQAAADSEGPHRGPPAADWAAREVELRGVRLCLFTGVTERLLFSPPLAGALWAPPEGAEPVLGRDEIAQVLGALAQCGASLRLAASRPQHELRALGLGDAASRLALRETEVELLHTRVVFAGLQSALAPLCAGRGAPCGADAARDAVVAAAAALTRVHSGGAPGHRPQQPSPRQAGAAQRVALCAQQLCALGEADWRTLLHAAYSAFVPCLATGVGSVAAALAPFFARAAPTCAPPGNPAAR